MCEGMHERGTNKTKLLDKRTAAKQFQDYDGLQTLYNYEDVGGCACKLCPNSNVQLSKAILYG